MALLLQGGGSYLSLLILLLGFGLTASQDNLFNYKEKGQIETCQYTNHNERIQCCDDCGRGDLSTGCNICYHDCADSGISCHGFRTCPNGIVKCKPGCTCVKKTDNNKKVYYECKCYKKKTPGTGGN